MRQAAVKAAPLRRAAEKRRDRVQEAALVAVVIVIVARERLDQAVRSCRGSDGGANAGILLAVVAVGRVDGRPSPGSRPSSSARRRATAMSLALTTESS